MQIKNVIGKVAGTLLVMGITAGVPAMAYQAGTVVTSPVSTEKVLSFAELEKRALATIPDIREMEVQDLLLKVKGYDADGRKVKLVMDRRSGAVLSHQIKYGKHNRAARAR